jgi:hypothetical protein
MTMVWLYKPHRASLASIQAPSVWYWEWSSPLPVSTAAAVSSPFHHLQTTDPFSPTQAPNLENRSSTTFSVRRKYEQPKLDEGCEHAGSRILRVLRYLCQSPDLQVSPYVGGTAAASVTQIPVLKAHLLRWIFYVVPQSFIFGTFLKPFKPQTVTRRCKRLCSPYTPRLESNSYPTLLFESFLTSD